MEITYFLCYCCYTLSFITFHFFSSSIMATATATTTSITHSIITDQDALLALKDHITPYPNQILAKNWSAGSSICDWTGVTCGKRHHRVTALDISSMGLTGTISPHLGNLSFLVSLNLSDNNFHGDWPHELANLSRLKRLNLSVNALTGSIPYSIGSLNQLEYLYLENNTFTGSIPSSISNLSNLKIMVAFQNELSGSIPFELFNISSLQGLSLAFNHLSGSLPTSMCRYLPNLKQINLWYNELSGPLPSSLSQCSNLISITLSHNNFSGTIPEDFCNMNMLQAAYFQFNSLQGSIPKQISNLTNLRLLLVHNNSLTGVIPKEIGNMTMLTSLYLSFNPLRGTIPKEFGNLVNLEDLVLDYNGLSGSIPPEIFNNSSAITTLSLAGNYLSGSLVSVTGVTEMPYLESIGLFQNSLSGVLPPFISNSSGLRTIDLSLNSFKGTIPNSFGNLRFLEELNLGYNNFTRDSSSLELEFLIPLANCKQLKILAFHQNPLNGIIPKSIGNLSKSIETFDLNNCGLLGEIPDSIGNLSNLVLLTLVNNRFTGYLPTSVASLKNIQSLDLSNNKLSGTISCDSLDWTSLFELYLNNNMFSGAIPECIGNIKSLRKIWLSTNNFSSSIPMSLWNLKDIIELNLSSNFLNSSLPIQVGNLKVVTIMDLSMNNLSGDIPKVIGSLQNLIQLDLSYNLFEGSIPDLVGRIAGLEHVDLSKNNLSGSIPITLEKLQYMKVFNVSYNDLVGLIPSGGPFMNLTWESFMFNKALCGDKRFHVSPCPAATKHKLLWIKRHKKMFILTLSLVALITVLTVVMVVCIIVIRRKSKVQRSEQPLSVRTIKDRISFYELQHATDMYNERNLLGQGSFGSVYKGTLRDGRIIAVKVFNLQKEGALKSFDVECEMLRNLRHRNLTHVISSCSNPDFKAIVLEFMRNGSLEDWLHSGNLFLSFNERLNIMIDVASALQYLHSGYTTAVVHADLKPSNVLLDEGMVAHVSDFGIAKMLEEHSITYTSTLATFGYIAPEYGSEGLISTKSDVYSFGIMLMEVFTRKRPNDKMFNENMTLRNWVSNSMETGALTQILDDSLLNTPEKKHFAKMMDSMTMIMNVALNCTNPIPRERNDIGEVVAIINKIKLKL